MAKVKICGVRRVEDALAAAEAGADFIGLNFVPNRRRRITVETAREIVAALEGLDRPRPQVVGLFADQPMAEIERAVAGAGLEALQLCGAESLDFCQRAPAPVFRVVHVPAGGPPEGLLRRVAELSQRGHRVTLDRLVEGLQGGTGKTFDWSVAAEVSRAGFEYMLAGGLTPDNVSAAINRTGAWGVDVSSGIESHGAKDPEKIRRFVANARAAFAAAGKES